MIHYFLFGVFSNKATFQDSAFNGGWCLSEGSAFPNGWQKVRRSIEDGDNQRAAFINGMAFDLLFCARIVRPSVCIFTLCAAFYIF